MKKNNLLSEVMADAETLKKVAIKTAQLAMENSIAPKLQSLLANKLSEELDDSYEDEEDKEEDVEKKDEAKHAEPDADNEGGQSDEDEDNTDESLDIDAILAEIEGDSSDEDDEIKDEAKKADKEKEPFTKPENNEDGDVDTIETDEEFDLSSLLAEEDDEDQDDEDAKDDAEEEKIDEADDKGILISAIAPILKACGVTDEQIKKLTEKGKEIATALANSHGALGESKKEEDVEEKSKEVDELKETLKEVNRSNAKLLFLSKLLYNNSLTNEGKAHIVKQLDKGATIKEVKLVYETLSEGFKSASKKGKKNITESFSSASAASGTSTKKTAPAVDPTVARWQQLAGITK